MRRKFILFATKEFTIRAWLTLGRALFRKKCGALHLGRTGDLFRFLLFFFSHHRPCVSAVSSPEKLATFFSFLCSSLSFTRGSLIIWGMQKFAAPFVGPPFCGAPVRPNMLNMPKSAAVYNPCRPSYPKEQRAGAWNTGMNEWFTEKNVMSCRMTVKGKAKIRSTSNAVFDR